MKSWMASAWQLPCSADSFMAHAVAASASATSLLSSSAGTLAKEGNGTQRCCSLGGLAAVARERLAGGSASGQAEAPAEPQPAEAAAKEQAGAASLGLVAKESGTGSLSSAARKRPCARRAGTAKEGQRKRPAPPAMGSAGNAACAARASK
mgnify:CR=1 FL=1